MCIRLFISLILCLPFTHLAAKECNWQWFMAHGFPNDPSWEVTQGCADVQTKGNRIVARLFTARPSDAPPLAAAIDRTTGKEIPPEYPDLNQVAEIEGTISRNWHANLTYARWGTDEGGMTLGGDYFSHKYKGGGYEGITLRHTGSLVIGLRHELVGSADPLFQRRPASGLR